MEGNKLIAGLFMTRKLLSKSQPLVTVAPVTSAIFLDTLSGISVTLTKGLRRRLEVHARWSAPSARPRGGGTAQPSHL